MKLIGIVGTNADKSYNRLLLEYIKKSFQDKLDLDVINIKDIPMFSENFEQDPDQIVELSKKIENADGVILGCPEYNHSIPSPLKSVLEWLSYHVHPLKNKPVMLVGASIYEQGSSRSQMQVKQVLDAPGLGAKVLSENEFLLNNAKGAFDINGNLKDSETIDFLTDCIDNFITFSQVVNLQHGNKVTVSGNNNIHWDAKYDTVVVGFGGAGATAARFAADNGNRVLLVDVAPDGHEGGNTRYSAQMINSSESYADMLAYYKALTEPYKLNEEMINVYAEGMSKIPDYLRNYLDVEPVSWKHDMHGQSHVLPEYPELEGSQGIDITLVHEGMFDTALWKILRQKVLDRKDLIDVWLESPAKQLIQMPETKEILGVQILRKNKLVNIRAIRGVVLATGGFENNQEMIQNYLGIETLAPLGTLYNNGDGIRMGIEVGASLWHMNNYEALGFLHGLAFKVPKGNRARLLLSQWPELYTGSIFAIAGDGSRYFKEDEPNRHGHIYDHGEYKIPNVHQKVYLIFDQKQFEKFSKEKNMPYDDWLNTLISAKTISELATNIEAQVDTLNDTVKKFNFYAEQKKDFEYNRSPETMEALTEGPYYAAELTNTMLNTQGGPKRNASAEVLDTDNKAIPNLYSAGELGGISINKYQAGQNLAECLIFGKIAGENVSKNSQDESETLRMPSNEIGGNDLVESEMIANIPVKDHQYIGSSSIGMGGKVIVRVTYRNNTIEEVEVLQHHESSDVGLKAIKEIPEEIVTENSTSVDAISGASISSKAVKAAVADAISKVNI